ncbi:hypothetical protein HK104_007356 [Borealophlyctis nickersoniae]|nr:hypothetical protein HK104_007356 [Borealophlyctis nickersoniae]
MPLRPLFGVFPSEGGFTHVKDDVKALLNLSQSLGNHRWTRLDAFSGNPDLFNDERADELCADRNVLATSAVLFCNNFEYAFSASDTLFLLYFLGHEEGRELLFPAWGNKRISIEEIVRRFETRLRESQKSNMHLIVIADACYSGNLVDYIEQLNDPANEEAKELRKLLDEKNSSLAVQASTARRQPALGGVFTPWYCEYLINEVLNKNGSSAVRSKATTERSGSLMSTKLYITSQYAHYSAIGKFPEGFKWLLTRDLVPVEARICEEEDARGAKEKRAKEKPFAAQVDVHDIKLGCVQGQPELFAHCTCPPKSPGEKESEFILHIHGAVNAARKKVELDVRDGRSSRRPPAQAVELKRWLWLNSPKNVSADTVPEDLQAQNVETEAGCITFESYILDMMDEAYVRFGNHLFVRNRKWVYEMSDTSEEKVTDPNDPIVKAVWNKSRALFDEWKDDSLKGKKLIYLNEGTGNEQRPAKHPVALKTLDWDNCDHWRMICSINVSLRSHNVPGRSTTDSTGNPDLRALIPCPSPSAASTGCGHSSFKDCATAIHETSDKLKGCPSYSSRVAVCLHYHLKTYLYHPPGDLIKKYRSRSEGHWDRLHQCAHRLLTQWHPQTSGVGTTQKRPRVNETSASVANDGTDNESQQESAPRKVQRTEKDVDSQFGSFPDEPVPAHGDLNVPTRSASGSPSDHDASKFDKGTDMKAFTQDDFVSINAAVKLLTVFNKIEASLD